MDDPLNGESINGPLAHPPANVKEDPMFDTSPAAMARASMAAPGQLRTIIERMERLGEDKAAVAEDMKEVMKEAKGNGFDTKIIRKVLRYRKQDPAKRREEEDLTDTYLAAIGEK